MLKHSGLELQLLLLHKLRVESEAPRGSLHGTVRIFSMPASSTKVSVHSSIDTPETK